MIIILIKTILVISILISVVRCQNSVITNFIRIRVVNDEPNNGYVISDQIENFSGTCATRSKKTVEICSSGTWALYTLGHFSLKSKVLFLPSACVSRSNPYNIYLTQFADFQSARNIGPADHSEVTISVYQGTFFKGRSKDFESTTKNRFTANSAVITGGKKWVLYKKQGEPNTAVCFVPTGDGAMHALVEHEEFKDFQFTYLEVLEKDYEECPRGSKTIKVPFIDVPKSETAANPTGFAVMRN